MLKEIFHASSSDATSPIVALKACEPFLPSPGASPLAVASKVFRPSLMKNSPAIEYLPSEFVAGALVSSISPLTNGTSSCALSVTVENKIKSIYFFILNVFR